MARNKESERRERRSDKGQGQARAEGGRWDCSVSREREKDGWTRAQLACTEEKQNLRGIINHSGLSTVVLSYPSSLLTSYTPSSTRPEWQGCAPRRVIYVLSRTDTSYFVSSFACEKCGTRVLRYLYPNPRGFLDENLSRALAAAARFGHYYVALLRHVSNINPSKRN